MNRKAILNIGKQWFTRKGWKPFPFQLEAWEAYLDGLSGMVNAPTGSGKTYALGIPPLLEYIQQHQDYASRKGPGLYLLWITPIRALTKDLKSALEEVCRDLALPWEVAIRTGDTSSTERARQKRSMPEILITTPESLHLLLASKGYAKVFKNLSGVIMDEWHELMGSKRAVQAELALSRLKNVASNLKVWGISATIGNMDQALEVLLGDWAETRLSKVIRSNHKKAIEVQSILPDTIETFPWGGHLGISMLPKIIPIIQASQSSLIFTNTRAQAEIWYQRILDEAPELASLIALHHGSIDKKLRDWVENALHEGQLKAVICTSSLDLGVDFRPVETIIQIGGAKGVARFMQRAGRSGHQPGAVSRIYFLPTHSLELLEGAALRRAVKLEEVEERVPYIRSFDVLVQYLITLAVSDGFKADEILLEIRSTFSFSSISDEEWHWALQFITSGGTSLHAYDEFQKVLVHDGVFKVDDRKIALRHRLSIGTIVSDSVLQVKFVSGGWLGTIEEWFIAKLKPGDVFWFAGRNLELVRIKAMQVLVRKSKEKSGKVPSWMGGRMPLSSQLSSMLRYKLQEIALNKTDDVELQKLQPLLEIQQTRSLVPATHQLLIEKLSTREGHHLFCYPFEGRLVHEGIAFLLAYRLTQYKPMSFSIAFNDYGFELLCDQDIPLDDTNKEVLFSQENLFEDIRASVNATEMARRKFRDIASISGLTFKGFPGKHQSDKHLQSSSQLFFDVFAEYEPENLLYRQAFQEVMDFQLEEQRLKKALRRIEGQEITLVYPEKPTPFAFPILVDRLRERMSTEKLEDRIKKMKLVLEKA